MKTVAAILMVLSWSVSFGQDMTKTTYDNGNVRSEYKQANGRVAVTNFYEDGSIKETGYFKNGVPDGKWETFAQDGSKTAELNYKDGKRHGEFRSWDPYTNAYIEMQYANGEVLLANRYLKEAHFAAKDK